VFTNEIGRPIDPTRLDKWEPRSRSADERPQVACTDAGLFGSCTAVAVSPAARCTLLAVAGGYSVPPLLVS
jgi:hypothetical protein